MDRLTQLFDAINHNSYDQVKDLINGPGDIINEESNRGITPLVSACYNGNLDIIERLLKHGANPNHTACRTFTPSTTPSPIDIAVEHNNMRMLKLLMKYGADVNFTSSYTFPIVIAAKGGNDNYEMFKYILQNGGDVKLCSIGQNVTSILKYFLRKHYHNCELVSKITDIFVLKGNLGEITNNINSFVHSGCLKCFQMLIDQRIPLNTPDNNNNFTPIIYAMTGNGCVCQYDSSYEMCGYFQTKKCIIKMCNAAIVNKLVDLGADFYPLWDKIILPMDVSPMCDSNDEALEMCIRANGNIHSFPHYPDFERYKQIFFFLAMGEKFDLLIKYCEVGYTPPKEVILLHSYHGERASKALSIIWAFLNPRSLINLGVMAVRRAMYKNVLYGAKKLDIPDKVYKQITLGTSELAYQYF